MPKFVVTNKKTGKEEVYNIDKESITLGRLNTNDIELAGHTVSRTHAEIAQIRGDYFLVDNKSGNGTFLNGRKLKANEKNLLQSHDRIGIEDFEVQFVLLAPKDQPYTEEDTDSDIIEIKMIKKVLSALEVEHHPSLEVLSPPCEGRKVFFTNDIQELVIGRDSSCPLMIDSSAISRRHAVLHKKWGGVTITDLGSKNGTQVNNQKVQEKLLKDGDVVMLGNIKILYRNPQEINLEALSREYEKEDSLLKGKKESGKKEAPVEAKASSKAEAPPKEEAVSDQAKLSISTQDIPRETIKEPEEKKGEKDEIKKAAEKEPVKTKAEKKSPPKEAPSPESTPPPKKTAGRFSTSELIMLAIGAAVFLAACIGLIKLLF